MVIVPSSRGKSHSGVVLAPVRDACKLLRLWHHFGCALAKIILEGADPQKCGAGVCLVLARFKQVCCRRGPGVEVCLDGVCPQGNMDMGCTVSKLGSECWHLVLWWKFLILCCKLSLIKQLHHGL